MQLSEALTQLECITQGLFSKCKIPQIQTCYKVAFFTFATITFHAILKSMEACVYIMRVADVRSIV